MKVRAFVAFELSQDVRQRIIDFLSQLMKVERRVKWVSHDHVHLTIKFLGEVDEEKIPRVKDSLAVIAESFAPFSVRVKGTGVFPAIKNPRVIWIGVIDESGNLSRMHNIIDKEMSIYGIPMEHRAFIPHITLGRIKEPVRMDQLLRILEEKRGEDFGEWMINGLTLFKSQLRPEGPIYTALGNFPLVLKNS